jgi:hypothetical protein
MSDGGGTGSKDAVPRDYTCQRLPRSTTTPAKHTMVSCVRRRWAEYGF